jgi:MFS family permease
MLATLRNRNFALLWLGGLVSFFGDWVLFITLPVFVYDLTGSTLATGGMFIAQTLPRLLFGSIAGVFVDRWDRRRTMVAANLLCAAALLPLLLVHGPGDLWLIYLAAFAQTACSLFFQPAEHALVPRLVGETQLLHANALNALNWELTRLVAPPLGGLIMVAFGMGSAVAVDGASFLVSAALIGLIRAPGRPEPRPARAPANQAGAWRAMWRELADGLRLVRRDGLVAAVFVITATAMVAEGIINVLGFPWLREVLSGGALERGWLTSAQAVGGLLGGLLIGRVAAGSRPAHMIGVGGVALGLLSLAYANVAAIVPDRALWLPAAISLKLLMGVPIMGMFVSIDTLLQQSVADRFRGRVFGAYGAVTALAMLFGQAIASALGDPVGIVPVMNGVGTMYCAAGVLALLLLGRRLSPEPAAERARAVDVA